MDRRSLILVADIGGTNARFACAQHKPEGSLEVLDYKKLQGRDYASFGAALAHYIGGLEQVPKRAVFCAAGPIKDGAVQLTNSDWYILAKDIAAAHGFEQCEIYNDFSGMSRSIPELTEGDFALIKSGQADANAPILVIGSGTGFGVGYIVPTPAGWHVIASEGGHMAYSPQSSLEVELLKALQIKHGFVSVELVCAGMGMSAVHEAICDIHALPYAPKAPDIIRQEALKGDLICRDVCNVRAQATMGAAGDLALSGGARGGVVMAGGISERMAEFYKMPDIMERFLNRGPRSAYVSAIPIRLLQNPYAALIGAAALVS